VGFYSNYIFPRLLDWSLGAPEFGKYRRRALEPARGETLEIGFGNGESLVALAAAHPERDFVGIEVHRPGVGHLLLRTTA